MIENILKLVQESIESFPEDFIGVDENGIIYDGYSIEFKNSICETLKASNLETLIWKPNNDIQFILANRFNRLEKHSLFFDIYKLSNCTTIVNWQGNFVIFTKNRDMIEFYEKAKKQIE